MRPPRYEVPNINAIKRMPLCRTTGLIDLFPRIISQQVLCLGEDDFKKGFDLIWILGRSFQLDQGLFMSLMHIS